MADDLTKRAYLDALEDEILHLIEREWNKDVLTASDIADMVKNLSDELEGYLMEVKDKK